MKAFPSSFSAKLQAKSEGLIEKVDFLISETDEGFVIKVFAEARAPKVRGPHPYICPFCCDDLVPAKEMNAPYKDFCHNCGTGFHCIL